MPDPMEEFEEAVRNSAPLKAERLEAVREAFDRDCMRDQEFEDPIHDHNGAHSAIRHAAETLVASRVKEAQIKILTKYIGATPYSKTWEKQSPDGLNVCPVCGDTYKYKVMRKHLKTHGWGYFDKDHPNDPVPPPKREVK